MTLVPFVYHPSYSYRFPAGHRFPMGKFRYLHEFLDSCGLIQNNVFAPLPVQRETILVAHDHDYVVCFEANRLSRLQQKKIGLPWSDELVHRTFLSPHGTLKTCELALEYGLACHLAGGTHHAHRDFGSGFCVFNDLAITALHLKQHRMINRVLIIDCDVHQGDGTADILGAEPDLLTCSFHCAENFPLLKQQSDWDIAIPRGSGDELYMDRLSSQLSFLLEATHPDLVIYDAGVDVHQDDKLGYLNLTDEGIWQRDRLVIESCLLKQIPVGCVIGGGYDPDERRLAARHGILHQVASELFSIYCH